MKYHPILPALTALGCLACPQAHAADTWTQPYPGVDHLARSTPAPNEIHVVVVDLNSPAVRVRATKPADRGATVSDFASMYGCQIAINGDFFTSGFVPRGLAKGAGEFWSDTNDGAEESFVAFSVNKDVIISSPWDLVAALDAGHHDVVSGRELITIDGAAAEYVAGNLDVHPRTAVGVDATGQRLFVAVVDGRTTASVGMTLFQLGALMADVGAWQAINLDGGGSSAIAVDAEGGIVNHPSDGAERLVANHLGVAVLPYAALVESTSWRDGEVVSIEPGDVVEEYVEFRNMGTEAWTPGTTKLAPTPRDMPSAFGGKPQWLSGHRVSTVDRVVAPGEVARFALPVSGDVIGEYTQTFTLVQEGVTWFGDEPLAGGPDDDAVALTVRITSGPSTTSETFGTTTGSDSTGTSASGDTGVPDDQSSTAGADRSAETPDSETDAGANRGTNAGCNVGRSNGTDGPWLRLMLFVLLLGCARHRRAGRTGPRRTGAALSRAALALVLCSAMGCSGGGDQVGANSSGTDASTVTEATGSPITTAGSSTADATASPATEGGDDDTGAPAVYDCAEPDWTRDDWFEVSGCFYVLDVSDAYFNNWCYRIGSCTSGEPPPGKTIGDMIDDRDTLALVASLQGVVNRDAPTLYLIAESQPDESWLERLPEAGIWLENAQRHDLGSVEELLELFADHPAIAGSVAWNADEPYTLNVAFTLASAADLLVVRPGAAWYDETVATFAVVESLAGRFESKRSAYDWLTQTYLATDVLAPAVALYTDGWAQHEMLEGRFEEVGQGLISRDYLIADRTYFIGYGVHAQAPDPTQGGPVPAGEGTMVLESVFDAIRDRVGPNSIFSANGWPSPEYSFDCNGDGTINVSDHVNCEEWEWTRFLSTHGGALLGGPAGFYAKESANKSFFRHGPGVDLVVQPPPASPRELLARGWVSGPPRNHSFEAGSEPWVFSATHRAVYDEPINASEGDHFLQVNVAPADLGAGFHQDVAASISRGQHYGFEIDARLASGDAATVVLSVEVGGASVCSQTVTVSRSDYETVACRFQHVGADAALARLRVALQTAGSNVAFDQAVLLGATTMSVDDSREFVQFFLGDYDFPMAMQLVPIGVHPFVWDSREAGIPSGVGLTAYANRDTPPIFAYFAKTKAENQWFVMPDSGAGYVNPGYLPDAVVDDWAAWSTALHRPLGIRTGWVLNAAGWSDVPASNATGQKIRALYRKIAPEGIYYNAPPSQPQVFEGDLPVVQLLSFFAAGTSVEAGAVSLASGIAANSSPFSAFRAVFVSEQAVEAVVDAAHANGVAFEVVDPHTFMQLFRSHRGASVEQRLSVVAHTLPSTVAAGSDVSVTVDVRNDGWDIWVPADAVEGDCDGSGDVGRGCERIAWGLSAEPVTPAGAGRSPEFDYQRSELPGVVAPGETVTIDLQFAAPTRPGTHTFQLDGVEEGVRFFETAGNVPWQKTIVVE